MNVKIYPSKAVGEIKAPPSKSMAHRALICAALSEKSVVSNVAFSKDIEATANALKALGANVEISGDRVSLGGLNPFNIKEGTCAFCNESGSTLRFLLPLCMLCGKKVTLTGANRLFERPLSVYEEIAEQNGISFEKTENSVSVCGKLKGGNFKIRGDISSQFISGFLFALPLLSQKSSIEIIGNFESASYVDLTLSALSYFGIEIKRRANTFDITSNARYQSRNYSVEGDFSNAAFLDAFNLLDGNVKVISLTDDSLQGDRVYKDMFEALKKGQKTFDLSDCPDLAPVMFAVSSLFGGAEFVGTARLSLKESDRGLAMKEELSKFGVEVYVKQNSITVKGEPKTPQTELFGHNDHRIVMALSVLLTKTGGTIIGAEAVSKSYPDFFSEIKNLNIGLDIYDN